MLLAVGNRKPTLKWLKPPENVPSHGETGPQWDRSRSDSCVGSGSASRDHVPLSFHVATLLARSLHLVPSNKRRQQSPGAGKEGFPSTSSLKSKGPFTEGPPRRAPSRLTGLDCATCPSYTSGRRKWSHQKGSDE